MAASQIKVISEGDFWKGCSSGFCVTLKELWKGPESGEYPVQFTDVLCA